MLKANTRGKRFALNLLIILAVLFNMTGWSGRLGTAQAAPLQDETCPCSLWPSPVTPTMVYDNPQPIEMGLKFQANVAGRVTGVRFFKAAGATGTHIGRLWTTAGVKLAEVTFSGETASGWQTASFAEPVEILPNTTYIISYLAGGSSPTDRRFALNQGYFTSSAFTNGPLTALQNTTESPNGVYSDSGGFFNQSYNATNYWVDVVFDDTPDAIPPQVSATVPVNGAVDVAAASNIQATFDEAMDAATINDAAFELRGPGDTLVAATVSYDAGAKTAILDPNANLAFAAIYTAKVKGGSSGVKDPSGNALASDYAWTFTVESSDITPPTVASVSPAGGATDVPYNTQVAAVFSEALQPGTITAAQFELRGPGDSLVPATVTYDSGVNTARLTPSAGLTPGATYTAKVLSGPGNVLDLAGNPLAADYSWSFTTIPGPQVSAVKPINGVTDLRLATSATVYFSRAMDATTITAATFELRDAANTLVPAQISYNPADYSAVLDPVADLAYAATYTVKVKGGSEGVKDTSGLPLEGDTTWSFTTLATRPPVDAAPGGPILIVSDPTNLYTRYYTEILRTEGFNEFSIINLPALDAPTLAAYDVVLLGEMPLSAAQVSLLSDYVSAGGNLIAMRPDKQLAGLLGLTDAAATVAEGYLRINTTNAPGRGIVSQTLQYHGSADAYTLNGASALATLYSNRTTATAYPAVTLMSVGDSGGQAAAFAFDLSRSIIYTHQGNPAWQTGHVNPLQTYGTALDLFYPDWIDFERITIPQADEQQRFLANLILHMTADKKPLPRFWYLPNGKKAAVILTGDDHQGRGSPSGSSQVFFDRHISQSPAGCSVADWECVRSSSYGYVGALLTDAQAALYTALGFEFGVHADAGLASGGGWCGTWPADMPAQYAAQFNALYNKYASIPVQGSERNHCYSWFGYTGAPGWNAYAGNASVEDGLGIRFDTNISYNPVSWATVNPGYQMGSAMMMRFAQVDQTGIMRGFLDIYNGGTQMNDDNGQGAAAMRTIIDSYLNAATGEQGFYGGLVVNMHSDNWYGWSYDGSDQIVQSAQAHNIPVVSGTQMVKWLDGRNASSFSNLAWDGTQLTFNVTAAPGARNLRAMLPAQFANTPLTTIHRDGQPVAFTTETIKGIEYVFFSAQNGAYTATYTPDTIPPVISNVNVQVIDGQSATISWTTDEPANTRVYYGLTPTTLNLHAVNTDLTTAHSLPLSGLTPNTTYYYRVRSTDASLNTANYPIISNPAASFVTPSASFVDTTVSDFSAGSPDANCTITQSEDGEVILRPTLLAEFGGAALPAGWSKISGAGTAVVAGGNLTLDGATAGPATFYAPGQVLEAQVTFAAAPFQHIGFGVDYSAGVNDAWAIISTGSSGAGLLARSWNGSGAWNTETSTPIPGNYFGAPHLFRIEWSADKIEYYVDGQKVATHLLAITRQMRPMPADSTVGGPVLTVDWMRMTPYAPACTFTSRVMDALGTVQSGNITWNADVPTGTSLGMSLRSGNTPIPDDTWTPFSAALNGATVSGGRYLQYKSDLATSDLNQTPTLREVRIVYTRLPDTTPPTITGRSPADGAVEVASTSEVSVQFSEPMNPASFDATAFRLRAEDASEDTPATLTLDSASATLRPIAPLALGTTYSVRLAGSVTDSAGNPLGGDVVWSFKTTLSAQHTDTTLAHFEAGTPDANIYLANIADGALMLRPAEGSEFFGSTLPAGWQTTAFTSGGVAVVGNGLLTLDGARSGPTALYGPGRSLEGVLTFQAARFQHFGFAVNYMVDGTPWAIISTGANGDGLYARTYTGSGAYDTQITPIPGSFLGGPHLYRIDWTADHFDYYVDNLLVATHPIAIATQMRPMPADSEVGGVTLAVDWMRMTPYATPGSFISRVHDGGANFDWQELTWLGEQPSGTTVAFETRTGSSATPDGGWSDWQAVSGTTIASPDGRYLQYRVSMTGDDGSATPTLEAVDLAGRIPDYDLPTRFYGSVQIPVTPPVAGDLVSAEVAGVGSPFTAAITAQGGGLAYRINLPGDNPATPAKEGGVAGDEIVFRINGQIVAKAAWAFNTTTQLDFHPPAAAPSATLPAIEGSPVAVHANPTHLGADALAYEFDCTDNGSYEIGPQATPEASCTYADNSSVTARVRIRDAQGGESSATVIFSVQNAAPTATWSAPASVNEGESIALSLTNPSDPGSADQTAGFEYAFDCGSGFGEWGTTATASCPTDDNGSRSVAGKLRDKDHGERTYSATVTITDLAPTATISGPTEATAGVAMTLHGQVTCPAVDTCTYAWDMNEDGVTDATTLDSTYTWNNLGVYDVTLTVTDSDGSTDVAVHTVAALMSPDVLIEFSATALPGAIWVNWSTATETGIQSFNLYRATSLGGSRVKLNSSPIPTTGAGTEYVFKDYQAQPGQMYYYWLEPVADTGAMPQIGPVTATALYSVVLPMVSMNSEPSETPTALKVHAPR